MRAAIEPGAKPGDMIDHRRRLSDVILFAGGLAVVSGVWTVVAVSIGALVAVWLVGHIAMLVAAGYRARRIVERGADVAGYGLILAGTLLLGPAGALLAGIAAIVAERMRSDPQMLDAWYQRIVEAGDVDRTTRLATAVAVGRAVDTRSPIPSSFAAVVADGTVEQRQNALGLIARRFAPAYAAALKDALVSQEPVVRVQAAAVAVKVKAELVQVLDVLAAAAETMKDELSAAKAAAELDAIRATGLLDDADATRATAAFQRLVTTATVGRFTESRLGPTHWINQCGDEARLVVESELLRQHRFAEFRAVRAASHRVSD